MTIDKDAQDKDAQHSAPGQPIVSDDFSVPPADDAVPARAARSNVMLIATVAQPGAAEGTRHRVRDLATGGIRIDDAAGLRPDMTVLVSIGAIDNAAATVRWVRDGHAGLAFAAPIDPGDARKKAAIPPSAARPAVADRPRVAPALESGWIKDLRNPYRK